MEGITPLDLIMPLREQVYELRQRDKRGELTDPEEKEHYKFLCRQLRVDEKNLNKSQTIGTTMTASMEEQEVDAMFAMDDWSFEELHDQGKFDHLPPAATYHRELIVEDPEDRPPRPTKPCLCLPVELEKPNLCIPLEWD